MCLDRHLLSILLRCVPVRGVPSFILNNGKSFFTGGLVSSHLLSKFTHNDKLLSSNQSYLKYEILELRKI